MKGKKAAPPPVIEEEEGPTLHSYMLPGGFAIALGANRPEFIKLEIERVKMGKLEPTKELMIELMRLVMDLMEDREKSRYDLKQTEERRARLGRRNAAATKILQGHDLKIEDGDHE